MGIYLLKSNEMEARERHRAFWDNSSLGSPLVFAVAESKDCEYKPWETNLGRKAWDMTPEWHINMIGNYLDNTCFLADAMPVASLMVGLDITNSALLAGGDYDYSLLGDQIFYKRGSFCMEEAIKRFTPDNSLAIGLKNCYQEVINFVGRRACVNTPMTLDALGTIYQLSSPESFLKDLIKRPGLVKKRVEELTSVYLDFYDYFYRYLKEQGYGESSSWFQVFVEGKFESVRCDLSLMLSEDMFEEFVVQELTQVCEHMDRSLFNMSSVGHARFIDQLSAISSLDGVFWNPEPWYSGIPEYIEPLRRIKEKGKCLEIVCYTTEDAVYAARELGPDGLYLYLLEKFKSESELEEALDRINKACK